MVEWERVLAPCVFGSVVAYALYQQYKTHQHSAVLKKPLAKDEQLRNEVRYQYTAYAESPDVACAAGAPSWGYAGLKEAEGVPLERACGGGCPLTLALDPISKGSVVVDLGCGAGHDAIIAARMVGKTGKIYAVDTTKDMLKVAAENASACGVPAGIVEYVHASIDGGANGGTGSLPVRIADVVISNGVFNLTVDKGAAFKTAYATLKPGGTFLLNDCCVEPAPSVDADATC